MKLQEGPLRSQPKIPASSSGFLRIPEDSSGYLRNAKEPDVSCRFFRMLKDPQRSSRFLWIQDASGFATLPKGSRGLIRAPKMFQESFGLLEILLDSLGFLEIPLGPGGF